METPLNRGSGGSANAGGAGGAGGSATGLGGSPNIIIDTSKCGDGILDQGEACDDGNTASGDGCTSACQIEADYTCPTPGKPCVNNAVCGDGKLSSAEACDDGNTVSGDGCSADCKTVESGWQCRAPGKHCVPLCGDGVLTGAETCDDGNAVSGDGCSSTCVVEPGWSCKTPGSPCVQSVCGNGVVEAGESCDKGDLNGLFYGDGTGCSKTCTNEPTCRNAQGVTVACSTSCGDGNLDPGEQCDDGNRANGDGCSSTCQIENGFSCTDKALTDTSNCSSGTGQCLVLPITYRDFDGQQVSTGHPDFFFMGATVGSTKTVCVPNASGRPDPNFGGGNCANTDSTALCTGLVNSTLGTDGKPTLNTTRSGGSTCACRFTDWDRTGILNGVAGTQTCTVTGDGSQRTRLETSVTVIHSAAGFQQWYHDSTLGTKVLGTLELGQVGTTNQYQFSSSNGRTVYDDIHDIFLALPGTGGVPPTGAVTSLSSGFFPLENQPRTKVCNIWPYWLPALATNCVAAANTPVPSQWDPRGWYGNQNPPPNPPPGGPAAPVPGMLRNFYFSSEVRYLFRYAGGETLAFFGDDDVWVFINGHLVLDLGAPHERLQGTVNLTTTGAAWQIQAQDVVSRALVNIASGTTPGLGLQTGNTYEIAVFHADQHPRESNYQLTVSGFSTTKSSCEAHCGDGIVTATEECDDGANNSDTAYGGCTTQCKFGPFCGDGVKNGPEECDLGRNNTATYGETGCTPGCTLPHRCGDGIVDTAFGEQCDAGANNGGALCDANCKFVVH